MNVPVLSPSYFILFYFAEEDLPLANICANLALLYVGHCHSMTADNWCRSTPGDKTQAAEAEGIQLNQ